MYKVIDSFCHIRSDKKPEYIVSVSSKYGIFTCKASPCNEDMDFCSDYLGYRLAEYKCYTQVLKAKSAVLRERMNGIHNALEALTERYCALDRNGEHFTNDAIFLRDLVHQCNISRRDYEKVYSEYKRLRDGYKDFVNSRLNNRKWADEYIAKKRSEETE